MTAPPSPDAHDRQTVVDASEANARSLEREIEWFDRIIDARMHLYFEHPCEVDRIEAIPPPDLEGDESEYARLVREHEMDFDERLVLLLALLPQIRPQALDVFLIQKKELDTKFAEFGGRPGKAHAGFLPTIETAAFVLAGSDLQRRFEIIRLFDRAHFFSSRGLLRIDHGSDAEPFFSAAFTVSPEILSRLTSGITHKPDYGVDFPAKLITTQLGWDELVLPSDVLDEIEKLGVWLRHSKTILEDWGFARTLKPGYRSLFYGPPGTGKTLTAALLGAKVGVDVYRIDLSMIVSKYVGETAKNLAGVFDQAEHKHWILFFDEADALFGKRTHTASSHDRYANQEISYLLQRTEDFPGVVILASNLKGNIDDAFARRFQSVIHFPMPDAELRLQLWEGVFSNGCRLAGDASLAELAEAYELSGGGIVNVARYSALHALQMKRDEICRADLLEGIRREFRKEGKTVGNGGSR